MTRDGGSGEMLTALFPSRSAILLTALRASPTEAFPDEQVVTLRLTQEGVDRMAALIWQALEKSADGAALRLADGPYPGSLFFSTRQAKPTMRSIRATPGPSGCCATAAFRLTRAACCSSVRSCGRRQRSPRGRPGSPGDQHSLTSTARSAPSDQHGG
jgi:Protein of unknown function (DUF2459)